MRFDHQKAFPYPVLRPDIDDYLQSEFQVTVDIEGTKDNKRLDAKVHVALSSDQIKREIAKGNAAVTVVFSCRDTYFRETITTDKYELKKSFDAGALRGEVVIYPFVVALKSIKDFSAPDINGEFRKDQFSFEVGEVLAAEEPKVIYIDRELFKPISSILQLVRSDALSGFEWKLGLVLLSQKVADHRQRESLTWRDWSLARRAEMGLGSGASETRFAAYVAGLAEVVGHADRTGPLRDYCTGLMLPGERKSVEPMAARTAPARTAAQHQSLLHFVGVAAWSDEAVLSKVRELVLPAIEQHGPIEAWIIDDTAFPKQGKHSVGVHHQYCGQLGKQANCQVAVSLSIANHSASLPVAYRLYLPQAWAADGARRNRAGVPSDIDFKTKPEIALEQIRWACEAGLPRGAALMDVAYGNDSRLRTGLTALGLGYVAGIQPNTLMWPSGAGPKRRGNPLNNTGRRDEPALIAAKEMALALPKRAWRTIRWREGSAEWLSSRFARVRVGVGHNKLIPELLVQEWLLIEWPEGEAEPIKYWLSTLPADISFRKLVDFAKLRWRIERDYQELKQEVGLGHYEGRGWRGFHHHATLCIAAYGFLIAERAAIPPSGPRCTALLQTPTVPEDYRPRGAALAA